MIFTRGKTGVSRRALIIGGSVGGLFAATLLRTIGWETLVFERTNGNLADRGTGIGTREELFAVMRRIGIAVDASIGVDVRSRICLDRDGTIAHELPIPAVTSSWARIYRRLRDALPAADYRAGMPLARIDQDADAVTAIFVDGTRVRGDLLIGADGLHSTVRRQFLPDLAPRYAGYVAWRGAAGARDLPPELQATILPHMVFCFSAKGLMLSIPMPADDDGGRACHFVWFRPVDETNLAALCTDAEGRSHGVSIPPPLIRPEVIREVKASAQAELAPQIAALVTGTPQPILQPIFDLETPRLVFGRVALSGDAAFVARPHTATGVMKAALDAQCLTDALAGGDDLHDALADYEDKRSKFGRWLVERGRHIGTLLAAQPDGDGSAGKRQVARMKIDRIMREYGAAGVVADEAITARDFA
jgi:2-polyprenyl-6-methoxyphenol hydroxylase-like FAD-dependent oxidoreductase